MLRNGFNVHERAAWQRRATKQDWGPVSTYRTRKMIMTSTTKAPYTFRTI